jgi:parvulin-like peptidyl-prolyl cis-trans isomerase-like protein
MRRLGSALFTVALAGCGVLGDAFSAHARVAASAAGQTLTVEQLATWAVHAKKFQPKAETFAALATIYVDYMVYAAQVAKGADLDDSLLVLKANWPLVSQVKWDRFHEQLLATRSHLTPAQLDSTYQAGDIRLFQHILLQVPAGASPTVIERKRVAMERVLREATAKHGTNFAALARHYSEDPGSKTQGGYLRASGRGQFVAPFEKAAWELQPGGLSGVVRSPFGVHIIRRPPLAEVRDSFGANLAHLKTQRFDSIYVDNLEKQRGLTVNDGAPAIVRQVFADLEGARGNTRTLVRYRGGAFRVKDLVRWIFAINSEEARGLPNASDDQLRQFLRVVTQRELLLQQGDSAGVHPTPDDWKEIRASHDSALALLNTQLGISLKMLADSAPTVEARVRLAAAHVNSYLARLLGGEARFSPVPPFLAVVLREREPWAINAAGVTGAVDRAMALRASEDSLRPRGMRLAPGPAPIPLDTVSHRTIR